MVCSVCSMDTCSRPECCVDDDCPVIKICVNIYCSLSIRMDMFAKMRNVWRKENVTLAIRVKMQMQSVISQTITTVNGVTWMRKSVSQDVELIRIVLMKLQLALCTTVLVLVTQG